jgi:hypothetical protein
MTRFTLKALVQLSNANSVETISNQLSLIQCGSQFLKFYDDLIRLPHQLPQSPGQSPFSNFLSQQPYAHHVSQLPQKRPPLPPPPPSPIPASTPSPFQYIPPGSRPREGPPASPYSNPAGIVYPSPFPLPKEELTSAPTTTVVVAALPAHNSLDSLAWQEANQHQEDGPRLPRDYSTR